jgi:hypothetical protein
MRRCGLLLVAVFAFGLCGAAKSSADDLIVNGSFENPDVGGSWNPFSNGEVPGWNAIDAANPTTSPVIEIDNSGESVGGPAYDGVQSLEVNAYNPEDVYQTITGLTVGQTYVLSWAYGDRPGSGDEELQVYFTPTTDLTGATAVATDYDNLNGSNPNLLWFPNVVVVTAASTTEVLSFNGVYCSGVTDHGGASYGNEIDAVSLTTAPEPSTLFLFASGLGLLGFVLRRRRTLLVSSRL